MRILIVVATLAMALPSFAISSGKGVRKGTRPAPTTTVRPEVTNSINSLNNTLASLELSARFEAPKETSKVEEFVGKVKSFEEKLNTKGSALLTEGRPKAEFNTLLVSASGAMLARNNYRTSEAPGAAEVVKIIDNVLTIIEAKVEDPRGVNDAEMVQIFDTIAKINAPKATVEHVQAVNQTLASLGKTAREVWECK